MPPAVTSDDRGRSPKLTVPFEDPQVAAAMGPVVLSMEYDETIGAPRDPHSRSAPMRQHIDGLVAA
jgi:hypothetical protein